MHLHRHRHGNAGKTETDIATASGADDDGHPVSGADDATVNIISAGSSILVEKTASPTSLPEPGGPVVFTVRVTNTSPVSTINLTSLVDNVHGNLAGQGTCVLPQTIPAGAFYQCTFTATVSGNAGKTETDTVTATGADNTGKPVTGSDSATVTITNVPSSMQVIKTANPTSLAEPGGTVAFTVRINNTSTTDALTLTNLVDSIHGNLAGRGTCVIPQTIAAGGFYQCIFSAAVSGNAGYSETDIVTATAVDDDNTQLTGQDDAIVTITDVSSSIRVTKTANPTTVVEPGGAVQFTVRVDNTSAVDSVTITSLIDSIHGNLNGQGACAVPQTIPAGGFYQCTFTATVSGSAGKVEIDVVTASGIDDDGRPVNGTDDATVNVISAGSSILVTKTVNPTTLPEPGGNATFTVRVDNTSPVSPITLNNLVDNIHGNLNGRGTCVLPQTIPAGGFYQCTFTATVSGNAGYVEIDTVTGTGTDNTGKTVTSSDTATVSITNVPSSIRVTKTANPTSLPEPGGAVQFTVRVDNTSAVDNVTINSLIDSIHGNLNGQGTCAVPQTIPAGGFYQCTFTATVNGNAGYAETDIVTATGTR